MMPDWRRLRRVGARRLLAVPHGSVWRLTTSHCPPLSVDAPLRPSQAASRATFVSNGPSGPRWRWLSSPPVENVASAQHSFGGRQRLALMYAAGAAGTAYRLGIRHVIPPHVRAAMEGSIYPEVRALLPTTEDAVMSAVTGAQAKRLTQLLLDKGVPVEKGGGTAVVPEEDGGTVVVPPRCSDSARPGPRDPPGGAGGGGGAAAA